MPDDQAAMSTASSFIERHDRYGAPNTDERWAAVRKFADLDEGAWRDRDARDRRNFMRAARSEFRAMPKTFAPCAACGKHIEFVHAHHCLPLALQYELGMIEADHSHDWLCPTHHKIIHIFISIYMLGTRAGEILDRVPDEKTEEWVRVGDLFQRGWTLFKEQGGEQPGHARLQDKFAP